MPRLNESDLQTTTVIVFEMSNSKDQVRDAFKNWRGGANPLFVACAPGRVNLVGEHTDYNDGLALPMTLDRGIYIAARHSSTGLHELRSMNYGESISYRSGEWPGVPHSHWATYVAGMMKELPPPEPVELLIFGNIPVGAGLSSSAALEMATGLALEELRGTRMDPLDLARIGQVVEHKYAKVQCGIMDQIISRVGRADHVLFLDCGKLEWEHIPIQSRETRLVVIDSQVKRKLAHSKYNERYAECRKALKQIEGIDPQITSMRQIQGHHIDWLEESVLQRRLRHIIYENERVRKACDAFLCSDWDLLGSLLSASHRSLKSDYEVSCEELDYLVSEAESRSGVFGARIMGGGFGGCSINLIRSQDAHSVAETVSMAYEEKYQRKARIHVLGTGIEAHVEWV